MALQPVIESTSLRDGRIKLLDVTGVYSSTNLTGYNSPNHEIADFETITIRVYLPDPVTLLPDSTNYVDIVTPTAFPNTSSTAYHISNIDLDADADADSDIPDGIYQIDLILEDTATDPSTTFTASSYVAVDNEVRCCKNRAGLKLSPYKCSCNNPVRSVFDELVFQLAQIEVGIDAEPQNITHSAKAMKRAADICEGSGCGCS